MITKHGKSKLTIALMLAVPLMFTSVLYAARPIDLNQENVSILQSFISAPSTLNSGVKFKEISRNKDRNQKLHIRFQQTYEGHTVWGADGVLHVSDSDQKESLNTLMTKKTNKGAMDGTIYQNIHSDLAKTPASALTPEQAQKALASVKANYQHLLGGNVKTKEDKTQLIVFIDKNNTAHWAYHVSFYVDPIRKGALPEKPNVIVDALTLTPYEKWDDIQTKTPKNKLANVDGGGFGGNVKMGKLIYDGLEGHLAKLLVTRTDTECFLKNDDVTVKHYGDHKIVSYPCQTTDPEHNNVYWDGELEAVNDGYSPPNDALFGGMIIKDMYQNWYGVPVLVRYGKPMMLTMVVHDDIDNAYWDGSKMTFGDGVNIFYPLTSLGVAAHEISHGFTQQHSNLRYYGQTGGMNESFSDMAAQAAEVYAYGKNSWEIGPEIFKEKDRALRYMDQPSKDCKGKRPGNRCSIDSAKQYMSGLDVHYSSGVYNHFYYILGTSPGWDVRKVFDIAVHANSNYWTSSSSFTQAACGMLKAASDLKYDVESVKKAFSAVDIDTGRC